MNCARLPGIGDYTAGAIASLAFGIDAPVLDGNVIRIFTRLFDIADDITQTATKNALWKLRRESRPGGPRRSLERRPDGTGAAHLHAEIPACDTLPDRGRTAPRSALGVQHERPVKTPKPKTPHFDVTAAVIRREDGRILIAQRPADGMLGGLWEFPGGKREPGESLPECLRREIQEELGIEIEVGRADRHRAARLHSSAHHAVRLRLPLDQRRTTGDRLRGLGMGHAGRNWIATPSRSRIRRSSPCCATAAANWQWIWDNP